MELDDDFDECEPGWRAAGPGGCHDVEALVLGAFRRYLGDDIGPDEDFFGRGGDSTQAMQIVHDVSRGVGAQVPTDILFRYPTARRLAAFLRPGHDGIDTDPHATVVAFARGGEGLPVFLVPALYPSPWVFLPLVEAMTLSRPVYGLRSPELDWRADVLGLGELVAHYAIEIRRLQPRGPYTLVGYSFGGLVAFELARRLSVEDEVRDLILLDTGGPPRPIERLRRPFREGALVRGAIAALCRRGILGARLLRRVGVDSPLVRATLALGDGPLAIDELRAALRLADPATPGIDRMPLEALCATLLATLRAEAAPAEWAIAQRFLPLNAGDPVAAVRGYHVLAKNLAIARRHRVRGLFDGTISIFAYEGNPRVLLWRRHTTRPLAVRWVAAQGYRGVRAHMSFLDRPNVRLYVGELTAILEGGSGRARPLERKSA